MANVQVIQRNAHLAGPVRLDTVNGREGPVAKAVLTAISNTRRAIRGGEGEAREEERTAILWTLWGKQAENAAKYLGRGSHVNIVGRLRNDHYRNGEGEDVFGFAFTCEEIDYLDTKAQSQEREARREQDNEPVQSGVSDASGNDTKPTTAKRSRSRKAGSQAADADIPF